MSIVSFDKESIVDYIPEYGGNRESSDPCVVSLRFVPYSRVQEYSRLLAARTRGVADSVKVAELTQHVQRKQFVENVENISGYFVGSMKVTSPGEFFDTADTDLVLEVIRAMESASRLTDGQRKN
ncbi:MAG: hypothetical protein A2052_06800 [Deltaproteobacteria bacterium GWA2_54_12]|nr:MAG: hypothetical protein A2052_06800 [Deltaproteobacteria bacterium GWA2_54_12]